jgi:hypothetical protein
MKKFFLSLVGLTLFFSAFGQNYWQQRVEYKISVKLNDVNHSISGHEAFVYHNNSSQTLDFLYIHLWPNAYRDGKTALGKQQYEGGEEDLTFGADSLRGGIDSLNFTVDGVAARYELDPKNPDIAKLFLPSPLKAGGKITVETPFKVMLPSGSISRLGHIGQSYQITQWYPKPAVFDQNGWNQMPYLNQGEFYSEYGSFDVSITLPKNYVLGATGDLQTESEMTFLNEKVASTKEFFKDFTPSKKGVKDKFPESSKEWKTVRYTQDNVHDFAWFADKRWLVQKGEVELPASKRKVTSWTMFTPSSAKVWENSLEYVNDGTYYYSLWNGDYPYNNVTAVDGTISAGGGMEYPTITVIGSTGNKEDLEVVIVHEVGHNWFYGILGSNERVHGWMDEGMNTLNEMRYMYTKYPENTYLSNKVLGGKFHFDDLDHHHSGDYTYRLVAALGMDQPMETHSADFTSANYGAVMYMKTGLVFNYLKEYLGDELFDKCMHAYYDEWHFKHPQPKDMEATLERVSGKNLDWLFQEIIPTTNHIDYKLTKVKASETGTEITVKNTGQVNGPIEVVGLKDGKVVKTQWIEPSENKTTITWSEQVDAVQINHSGMIPEINQRNNSWKQAGLFGKFEKLELEGFVGKNEMDRSNIFWTPAMGWNTHDKFMLGATFHNFAIPLSPWQFQITPLYSFGGKRVSGIADIMRTFLPKNYLKSSTFGLSVRSFKQDDQFRGNDDYYVTASPFWKAKLGHRKAKSPVSSDMYVQGMYRLDVFGPSQRELVGGFGKYTVNYTRPDHKISATARFDYLANAVNGDQFSRGNIEADYALRYWRKKDRWIEFRGFLGSYFNFDMYNSGNVANYTYALSGANGAQDVFTEEYFFGRNEVTGGMDNQRMDNWGGFKTALGNPLQGGFGNSNTWMSGFNVVTELPYVPKVFVLFADFGVFENGFTGGNIQAYDFGVAFKIKKVFAVYFPLVASDNINDAFSLNNAKYSDRIRFSLNINLTNKTLKLGNLF